MSSSFNPTNVIDMSKEKDWPVNLGMLDWDATSIVFTKRSLIEFLKYTGTTVDPNFTNIQKLPKYAKFGKISAPSSDAAEVGSSAVIAASDSTSASDAFKPSRGPHTDIFGHDTEGDALSLAPPRPEDLQATNTTESAPETRVEEEEESGINFTSSVKPSRRVRTNPGGNSALANFWDGDEQGQEVFKPSRRVRQGPGGQDHINGIF